MPDKYKNFAELQNGESEGTDFRISLIKRKSGVAIVAPHGGKIEPGTSEIAAAIAGDVYNLYCFEGGKNNGNSTLHITSTNFDEPRCLDLLGRCDRILSVHGLSGSGRTVDVGGLDRNLRDDICANLKTAGFQSKVVVSGSHAAISKGNICNKGRRKKGVQLEITKGLRDALQNGDENLEAFASCVRRAASSQTNS